MPTPSISSPWKQGWEQTDGFQTVKPLTPGSQRSAAAFVLRQDWEGNPVCFSTGMHSDNCLVFLVNLQLFFTLCGVRLKNCKPEKQVMVSKDEIKALKMGCYCPAVAPKSCGAGDRRQVDYVTLTAYSEAIKVGVGQMTFSIYSPSPSSLFTVL